jgi:hypothetical protein
VVTTWWSAVLASTSATSVPVLQVAGDGRWETSLPLPVTASPARLLACIEQVAACAERDVAVEALWPGRVFVGARWSLPEVEDALAGARRARAALSADGARPAEALLALLGAAPGPAPEFAELGAVNAWASVGPLTLWHRGGALTPGAVDEALESRPDLTVCRYPVAVEVAAVEPRPCWIGTTVSTRDDGGHRLDRAALDDVLARGVRMSR